MAKATLGGDDLACKSSSDDITTSRLPEHWHDLPGLIDDPLIDAGTQVAVLAQIDETGSATLAELMALLPGHANAAETITRFVRHGVLAIEPGLLDGNSLLYRRVTPPPRKASEPAGDAGAGSQKKEAGRLGRLKLVAPQPEIFFARGEDRAFFMREPYMRRRGIYMALYGNSAYVGRADDTACRIAWGAHLREHGLPDLVIAAVDGTDSLNDAQIKSAERQLARAVLADPRLTLRNTVLPDGAAVSNAEFAATAHFVRQVVTAVRNTGLAFALAGSADVGDWIIEDLGQNGDGSEAEPEVEDAKDDPRCFSLSSCGVVAHARVEDGKWIVLAGSQVRSTTAPSAGSAASQQRQELLYEGGLVERGNHLLLTEDLAFATASGAANFVVGSRHKPEIWRPAARPVEQGPRP